MKYLAAIFALIGITMWAPDVFSDQAPTPVLTSGNIGTPQKTDAIVIDTSGSSCSNLCVIYKFYKGGTSGTLLRTTTLTYTDTTHATLSTITRVDSQ